MTGRHGLQRFKTIHKTTKNANNTQGNIAYTAGFRSAIRPDFRVAAAMLRRKTCALLRAKTSALLRRKICAVLRARTCALFRANTKVAAFGRHHKGGRPSAAPLCGFLCVGSEHWAYLIVETQDMCLVESQDICLAETQDMCCVES